MTGKNLYEITFRHVKYPGHGESVLNVVAIDFDEALKKGRANTEKVQTQKDDSVELVGVRLASTVDVE